MTRAQLKFIAKWQTKLKLRDWDITIKEKRKFKHREQTGATRTKCTFLEATVWIRKGLSKQEFQRTVVHELLHIRFGLFSFDGGSALMHELEVGIEMLARLLLKGR